MKKLLILNVLLLWTMQSSSRGFDVNIQMDNTVSWVCGAIVGLTAAWCFPSIFYHNANREIAKNEKTKKQNMSYKKNNSLFFLTNDRLKGICAATFFTSLAYISFSYYNAESLIKESKK